METPSKRQSKGQVLVLAALSLTVLIGFVGLAADTGYFFDYRRRMTAAADSAAVAGALEIKRSFSSTQVVTAARAAAAASGFTHGTNGITVTVNRPPVSGFNVGNNNFVEVLINRPTPTFFLRVLNLATTTVGARAVAGPGPSAGCIQTLDPIASNSLVASGSAVINVSACGVIVNSTSSSALVSSGSARLTAQSISVAGSGYSGTGYTPTPSTSVPPTPDPFAELPAPTVPSSCVTVPSSTLTYNPGIYCSINVNTGSTLATFNSGPYIVKNGFTISSSRVSGTGVTFYIDAGSVTISGGSSVVQLSAPRSGDWEGILFFQNRSDNKAAAFSGGGNLELEGVLYFPAAKVTYSGGTTTNAAYTTIISNTLTFSGPSALNSNYAVLAGGSPIKKPMLGE